MMGCVLLVVILPGLKGLLIYASYVLRGSSVILFYYIFEFRFSLACYDSMDYGILAYGVWCDEFTRLFHITLLYNCVQVLS